MSYSTFKTASHDFLSITGNEDLKTEKGLKKSLADLNFV